MKNDLKNEVAKELKIYCVKEYLKYNGQTINQEQLEFLAHVARLGGFKTIHTAMDFVNKFYGMAIRGCTTE